MGLPSSSISEAAPVRAERAVVDECDARAGDHLADAARVGGAVLQDVVGFEAVPARLVKQDPTASALEDDGQDARRRRARPKLGDGPSGSLLSDLLHGVFVEHLVAEGVSDAVEAGLQAAVAGRDARHEQPGSDAVVVCQQSVRVRHQDAAPAVAVAGTHLNDGPSRRTGGVVGLEQQVDLVRLSAPCPGASSRVDAPTRCLESATLRTPPPPSRATAAAAWAADSRPVSDKSAVWANPVVSPTMTLMPAPRSRPLDSSSTLRSSRKIEELERSSAKISAKSPPRRSASLQDTFEDGRLDEVGRRTVGEGHCVGQSFRPSMPPSTPPPMPAATELPSCLSPPR